jgi:cytochrome c oxidase cbb3-type subunit III
MSEKLDEILDHHYDGIREYDNPMPGWWVAIFWVTIVFAAAYFVWYHAPMEGRSIYDGYEESRVADLKAQFKDVGELKPLEVDAATLAAWAKSEKYANYRAIGKAVFKSSCVSCHGDDATGLVGPNLTDNQWKNVKVITDIPKVITYGANKNAMPAKGGANLSSNEIAVVAAYVASLREHPVAGGKHIDGEAVIPAWPEVKEESEKK